MRQQQVVALLWLSAVSVAAAASVDSTSTTQKSSYMEDTIAKAGQRISFTCPVTEVPSAADYQWRKIMPNKETKTIFRQVVIDMMDSDKYKVSLDTGLTLETVSSADVGDYQCIIKTKTSPDREVILRQYSLSVVEAVKCSFAATNQSLVEDKQLVLHCSAQVSGRISPSIYWEDEKGAKTSVSGNYPVWYLRLGRDDHGKRFTCVAKTGAFEEQCHTDVVNVLYGARVKSLLIGNNDAKTQFKAGERVELRCEADGNPPAVIMWYFKNKQSDQWRPLTTRPSLRYVIESLVVDDSGEYKCEATNVVDGYLKRDESQAMLMILSDQEAAGVREDPFRILLSERFVGILGGIFAVILLIIILILLLIFLHRRRSRGRNRCHLSDRRLLNDLGDPTLHIATLPCHPFMDDCDVMVANEDNENRYQTGLGQKCAETVRSVSLSQMDQDELMPQPCVDILKTFSPLKSPDLLCQAIPKMPPTPSERRVESADRTRRLAEFSLRPSASQSTVASPSLGLRYNRSHPSPAHSTFSTIVRPQQPPPLPPLQLLQMQSSLLARPRNDAPKSQTCAGHLSDTYETIQSLIDANDAGARNASKVGNAKAISSSVSADNTPAVQTAV